MIKKSLFLLIIHIFFLQTTFLIESSQFSNLSSIALERHNKNTGNLNNISEYFKSMEKDISQADNMEEKEGEAILNPEEMFCASIFVISACNDLVKFNYLKHKGLVKEENFSEAINIQKLCDSLGESEREEICMIDALINYAKKTIPQKNSEIGNPAEKEREFFIQGIFIQPILKINDFKKVNFLQNILDIIPSEKIVNFLKK